MDKKLKKQLSSQVTELPLQVKEPWVVLKKYLDVEDVPNNQLKHLQCDVPHESSANLIKRRAIKSGIAYTG